MKAFRAFFVAWCFSIAFPTLSIAEPLTFAVVPQQSPKKMAEKWQPLIYYIAQYTGLEIEFRTAKDIPTFEENLVNGEYDIAYMNPYHYTVFSANPGYQALARESDKSIRGLIVVNKSSGITSIEQLNGMEMAFPAPAAFAATIITTAHLKANSVTITPRYVNSHDSVYFAVHKDFFNAGGGIYRTLKSIPSDVRENLHILWESKGFTPHAIATHPAMADVKRQAILKALLAITNDSGESYILDELNFNGFVASDDSDWDDVRALGIASLSRPHM